MQITRAHTFVQRGMLGTVESQIQIPTQASNFQAQAQAQAPTNSAA